MTKYCSLCAKPLKVKVVPGPGGRIKSILVCKSPICKKYGKAQ